MEEPDADSPKIQPHGAQTAEIVVNKTVMFLTYFRFISTRHKLAAAGKCA